MDAIDSMVLILAGLVPKKEAPAKSSAKPTTDEMAIRAKILLHMIREDLVILPAIAISEILVPVPKHQHGALIAKLRGLFLCPPFDLSAASIAADIWHQAKKTSDQLGYDKRHVLKADCMIVASAKAAGATKFYTADNKCRKLANLVMRGCDLPTRDPNDIFLESQIRSGEI